MKGWGRQTSGEWRARRGRNRVGWTAGFPVTNSELIFRVNPGEPESPYEDDPRLQQFHFLEKWHEDPKSRTFLVMDYIGPHIDTGFRLASRSFPRCFVISVDVAFLLVTSHLPTTGVIDVPPIFYSSKAELKGVLGGKPYPIFWIDTMDGEEYASAEDKLLNIKRCEHQHIIQFCKEFYKDNAALMFLPFIFREDESQYGEFPENYIEALEHLCKRWLDEKTRYKSETEIGLAPSGKAETLTEAESTTKEQEIISKLIGIISSQK